MMNSLFLGAIKGHTDLTNLCYMGKKCGFYTFLNSRRYYQCNCRQRELSRRLAVTSRVTSRTDQRVPRFTEEEQRKPGAARTAPGRPGACRASGGEQQPPLGLQGRPRCSGGEDSPPLPRAAPPAPQHCCSRLGDFAISVSQGQVLSVARSWVLQQRRTLETTPLLGTARRGQPGSSWDLQACCTLLPLCCLGFMDQEH